MATPRRRSMTRTEDVPAWERPGDLCPWKCTSCPESNRPLSGILQVQRLPSLPRLIGREPNLTIQYSLSCYKYEIDPIRFKYLGQLTCKTSVILFYLFKALIFSKLRPERKGQLCRYDQWFAVKFLPYWSRVSCNQNIVFPQNIRQMTWQVCQFLLKLSLDTILVDECLHPVQLTFGHCSMCCHVISACWPDMTSCLDMTSAAKGDPPVSVRLQ